MNTRTAWNGLFPEPLRTRFYDQRALDAAHERDGLRWFFLGWPYDFDSPAGPSFAEPGDYLVILGNPDEARVLDLIAELDREHGLLRPLDEGRADPDDLIQSYAMVVSECPDTVLHDDEDDEDEDPCETCATRCFNRGQWFLDWYGDGTTLPKACPDDRFPVWIWQINTYIGWR